MKKIILVLIVGLFTISAFSQKQQNRHEFSVWAGGGISTFMYDPSSGSRTDGFGGIGGLGYNYFLNYNWSIGIGGEFSLLNSKLEFSPISDTYDFPNRTNDLYRFRFEGQNYEQTQRGYYVNIPVQVKFQVDAFGANKKHKFYVAAGPKIGIPVKTTYDISGSVRATGVELNAMGDPITRDWFGTDNNDLLNQGFGLFNFLEKERELDLDINVIASIETGVKWKLGNKWSLYTGVFFDYGLNDLRKGDKSQQLFAYNPTGSTVGYIPNSALSAKNITDKVNTMAVGLKLQLAYGIKPFDKKEKEIIVVVEEKQPYEGLTARQMEDILSKNTQLLLDAQQRQFEELKALIAREDPDMTSPIVGFDYDKNKILTGMHPELDRKVALMKKYPESNMILEGHTDDTGSDNYNYQLGLDRAEAAKLYMVARGIAADRLTVTSKGKSNPAISNKDDASRAYNRRVEFILRK